MAKKKKIIYVSGKITGLDYYDALRKFSEAEALLKMKYSGCVIINPMVEVPYKDGKTWGQYMLDDIKLLFGCTNIYMIRGWRGSKGARIERFIAKVIGCKRVRI